MDILLDLRVFPKQDHIAHMNTYQVYQTKSVLTHHVTFSNNRHTYTHNKHTYMHTKWFSEVIVQQAFLSVANNVTSVSTCCNNHRNTSLVQTILWPKKFCNVHMCNMIFTCFAGVRLYQGILNRTIPNYAMIAARDFGSRDTGTGPTQIGRLMVTMMVSGVRVQ